MIKHLGPEYHIKLCAERYARATENIIASSSADQIAEMKLKLTLFKDAALEEAKAERRRRVWKLPEFLRITIDRGRAPEIPFTRADALGLIDYFAVPAAGTLGLLSSTQMDRLADQYEGWACTPDLGEYEAVRLNGMAIGLRRLAEYLGPFHEPYEPPDSLHLFLFRRSLTG
ncbi:hypothetical protein [Bradyrhizobium japonicum]|uniref:hypothetical protein n=1 Tax=Bradyrhizobium japonicum TaxID=375 RepID=UPI00057E6105|nr:hypothetical protein [Bradyrhizobium japonicum]MCD9113142.1 hypothetical protein [Bradyrhizobium japonicum]MCD9260498.1 hypothetical protein [Bradyrhizobium japonicum SEMIA 5079]MCD9913365.1 hypothetical protein [Bradyrhizobium japonicum]MCS3977560.1 hypothetical protein [Bradyrhizobium japonicum]WRI75716.1 hypothetical protein RZE83_21980 [Bradyrhizobium japonicum]